MTEPNYSEIAEKLRQRIAISDNIESADIIALSVLTAVPLLQRIAAALENIDLTIKPTGAFKQEWEVESKEPKR